MFGLDFFVECGNVYNCVGIEDYHFDTRCGESLEIQIRSGVSVYYPGSTCPAKIYYLYQELLNKCQLSE